ncbi:methylmalonyl-CoA epimerase [Chloroflexota bacterium]
MIIRIDHIGLAVNSVEEAARLYTDVLGLEIKDIEVIGQRARAAIIPVGESKIELLEPIDPEGPIAEFIAERGEGIHHLALEVDDIEATLKLLKEKEIPLVDEQPRNGIENSRIAFLHPSGTKALIELVEARE